jgi:uncharacterized damage-inducible protein DinB
VASFLGTRCNTLQCCSHLRQRQARSSDTVSGIIRGVRRRAIDLLDHLLGHDAWTTRQLLTLCLELTDQQLDREFDIGHKTVRTTFLHIIHNMETWCDVMVGKPPEVAPVVGRQERSVPALIDRLDRASADLKETARSVAQRDAWDDTFLDTFENPAERKTYGASIAHIVTHSMHHRAQVLYMLRCLNLKGLPEGDVFTWEKCAQRQPD